MADFTYTCPCGVIHTATPWMAANWYTLRTHRCPTCGRANDIRGGKVLRSTLPVPAAAPDDALTRLRQLVHHCWDGVDADAFVRAVRGEDAPDEAQDRQR